MIYSRITLNAAVKVIREAADRSVCSVSGTRSNTRDLKLRTRKTSRTVRLIDGYHLEFTFQTNIYIFQLFLTACIQDIFWLHVHRCDFTWQSLTLADSLAWILFSPSRSLFSVLITFIIPA